MDIIIKIAKKAEICEEKEMPKAKKAVKKKEKPEAKEPPIEEEPELEEESENGEVEPPEVEIEIKIDSSLDPEKLEEHLKILKKYGLI